MPRTRKLPPRKTLRVSPVLHKIGRPALNDPGTLLDIWAAVEVAAKRTGRSVHGVCKNAQYPTVVIGRAVRQVQGLSGDTLRRRYYEAKTFLQTHIDQHEEMKAAFARLGASTGLLTEQCAVERYWNAERGRWLAAGFMTS